MPLIESAIASFGAGLVGSVVNRIGDYHAAKLNNQLEIKRLESLKDERAHKLAVIELEMAHRNDQNEFDMLMSELDNDSSNFRKSMDNESSIGETYKWVNAVRALVRPTLTFGFAVALVFFPTSGEFQEPLINLTMMCVSWYFGSRVKVDYFRK